MSPEQVLKILSDVRHCSAHLHGEHWTEGIVCALCLSNAITAAIDEALGEVKQAVELAFQSIEKNLETKAKHHPEHMPALMSLSGEAASYRLVACAAIDRRRNALKERG